ncbi:MAG: hypothetical protein KGL39_32870 [Patescibacteria group bacterium]|nr:hypothetical protein [Patescibacteria group bacterium]
MNPLTSLLTQLRDKLQELLALLIKNKNMPEEEKPLDTQTMEQIPPETLPAVLDVMTIYPQWENKDVARHNVRVICDQEGLTFAQKNDLTATIHCESNFNPTCVNKNMIGNKVASTDYGICQINDYYHIGDGKDFPSVDYVLNNPEACVRWMCKMWLSGQAKMWVCYLKGMYLNY